MLCMRDQIAHRGRERERLVEATRGMRSCFLESRVRIATVMRSVGRLVRDMRSSLHRMLISAMRLWMMWLMVVRERT